MSGSTGYNFTANTKARASEVNLNFEWFRGHYLPVTQSGTWANTTGVYDLGSSSYQWNNLYLSGRIIGNGALVTSSSSEVGVATSGIAGTTLCTVDLGSISSGYRILFQAQMAFSCTGGTPATGTAIVGVNVSKTSGTGGIVFGASAPAYVNQQVYEEGTGSMSALGFARVNSSGTIVLQLLARGIYGGAGATKAGTSLYCSAQQA